MSKTMEATGVETLTGHKPITPHPLPNKHDQTLTWIRTAVHYPICYSSLQCGTVHWTGSVNLENPSILYSASIRIPGMDSSNSDECEEICAVRSPIHSFAHTGVPLHWGQCFYGCSLWFWEIKRSLGNALYFWLCTWKCPRVHALEFPESIGSLHRLTTQTVWVWYIQPRQL